MSLGADVSLFEPAEARKMARQIVFLMAVFSTVLGGLYLLGLVGKLIVDGTVHSSSSPGVQMVSAIVALLWDSALLVLFVVLRWQTARKYAVFTDLAVVFMALVCVSSSINWFMQLAILPGIVQRGEASLVALIDVHSPTSISYAAEHLGWGIFYGLATIFMAIALGGTRLKRWIAGLFIFSGALSLLHVIGVVSANSAIGDLGYLAWGVLLPITTTLLSIRFRR